MPNPDYSCKALLQVAEKAREEKRKKEEEAILNYRPSFWGFLHNAAKAGESSFKTDITDEHEIKMLRIFLERNGYDYNLENLESFFGMQDLRHTLTIHLIPKKEE